MNIAILGAGNIAGMMAKTLRMMKEQGEDVCLYAVGSRNMEKAGDFAQREGAAKAYGDYESMVSDGNIDLVYIATPHSFHAEQMKMCIEAGRAVLCEKAFTANAAQAREVLSLAKRKGVLVTEAIWTRYQPYRLTIQDILMRGDIGEPRLLSANLCYDIAWKERITRPELAGGALLDVGVYTLNFASMFFGDNARIEGNCEKFPSGVDRSNSISMYYPDGRVAFLHSSTVAQSDRTGVISGTEGYLVVDNINNPQSVTIFRKKDDYSNGKTIFVAPMLTGYEYEVRAAINALNDKKLECWEMPHVETIRMMEIMDELRRKWNIRYPFE